MVSILETYKVEACRSKCSSDQEAWIFVACLITLYKSLILFFTCTSTPVNSVLFCLGKFHLHKSPYSLKYAIKF